MGRQEQGLREYAARGVHELAAKALSRYVEPGAKVLELGAGAGAFSAHLASLGYRAVACDITNARFGAEKVPFVQCDLDEELPPERCGEQWQAVCVVEVIEHLKNPWKLLADCHGLLPSGGVVVLTTPNISSVWGRAYFLVFGIPFGFSKKNVLAIGHINPLTLQEVLYIAEQSGFELVERLPAGTFPVFDLSSVASCLRNLAFSLFVCLLRPMMLRVQKGRCHLLVLRKK